MTREDALIDAIKAGDTEQVLSLLQAEPALAATRTESGLSALLLAVYYGRREAASALAAGRELDLFEAAALGDDARAMAILQQQPERIDQANVDGFTPLGLAAYFGNPAVADLLLGLGATVDLPARNGNVTPLNSAAAGGNLEIARMLIEHGANVNAQQEGGFTPLHSAAQNGDTALAELLLAHGANPALATSEGKTPADYAANTPALAALLAK